MVINFEMALGLTDESDSNEADRPWEVEEFNMADIPCFGDAAGYAGEVGIGAEDGGSWDEDGGSPRAQLLACLECALNLGQMAWLGASAGAVAPIAWPAQRSRAVIARRCPWIATAHSLQKMLHKRAMTRLRHGARP